MPEDRTTVADLEDKWFELLDGDANMKPATRAGHKSNWKAHIKPKLGTHLVMALHVPALREWVRKLGDGLEPSTVRNNVNTLTRFLADVKAERWVTLHANPMRDDEVRDLMPKVSAPDSDEITHLTREQCETLLSRPELPRVRFGVYLQAVTSGMRPGEQWGLQWKHVDLAAAVPHVRVRQQLGVMRAAGERVALGLPKSKYGKRDLPIHPLALAWLTWWKAEGWTAYVEPVEGEPRKATDEDFVFPSPAGEAQRPRDAEQFRDDLDAAKLPRDFVTPDGQRIPFVAYSLRHTFASWLSARDVEGEQIDRLLGQSPPSVRGRHYSAPSLDAMARAVAKIALTLPERPGVRPPSPEGPSTTPTRPADAEPDRETTRALPRPAPVVSPVVPALGGSELTIEPPSRIELETYGLRNRCSTPELGRPTTCFSSASASSSTPCLNLRDDSSARAEALDTTPGRSGKARRRVPTARASWARSGAW